MDKRISSLLGLLLIGSLTPAKAQLDSVLMKRGIMQLCPRLSYPKDSVAMQVSLDSIAILLAGRWSLRIIETGWAVPKKPEKDVELTLDRRGRGIIHEDGQLVATIQLSTWRRYAMVRFSLNQEGQSIIRLDVSKRSGGHLGVCEEKLFLSDGYADGTMYAFRRIR